MATIKLEKKNIFVKKSHGKNVPHRGFINYNPDGRNYLKKTFLIGGNIISIAIIYISLATVRITFDIFIVVGIFISNQLSVL